MRSLLRLKLFVLLLALVGLGHPAQPASAQSCYNDCPAWSPDGKQIAFLSKSRESQMIYVMNADGTDPHPVTPLAMKAGCPAWSPDSKYIAFVSEQDGNEEIYVINADGQNLRNLTQHPARDTAPAWSPDGKHIAFVSVRDGNAEVYVMDADGANPRNLTKSPASDGVLKEKDVAWIANAPTWSPDGKHIAFVSDRDKGNSEIYVIDIDGSNLRNLTRHPGPDVMPAWSPDGKYIAFAAIERNYSGGWMLYIMQADGSVLYGLRARTSNSIVPTRPIWSPDSKWVAYSVTTGMFTGIVVRNVQGSIARGVSSLEVRNSVADWSPDGKQILFILNELKGENVLVMNADGSNPVWLTCK